MLRELEIARAVTAEQVKAYEENGYLLLPNYFSRAEIDVLAAELPIVFSEDSPRRITETNEKSVRSVYGSHMSNEVFKCLTCHPRLVGPAMQLLESDVY